LIDVATSIKLIFDQAKPVAADPNQDSAHPVATADTSALAANSGSVPSVQAHATKGAVDESKISNATTARHSSSFQLYTNVDSLRPILEQQIRAGAVAFTQARHGLLPSEELRVTILMTLSEQLTTTDTAMSAAHVCVPCCVCARGLCLA